MQILDMLYKKLSNKFKNCLVITKKAKNTSKLILFFFYIDVTLKKSTNNYDFILSIIFSIFSISNHYSSYLI